MTDQIPQPEAPTFLVVPRSASLNNVPPNTVILRMDGWDDFGFKTLFDLILFTPEGERLDVGQVKILRRGMTEGRVPLPEAFSRLDQEYCSLGQGTEYYEILAAAPGRYGENILLALRDVAATDGVYDVFKTEPGFETSLMRFGGGEIAIKRAKSYFNDQMPPEQIYFSYRPNATGDELLEFRVNHEANPPGNLHVLIGRNGTGKTRVLSRLAFAATAGNEQRKSAEFAKIYGNLQFDDPLDDSLDTSPSAFQNVVAISFSAFDTFELPAGQDDGGNEDTVRRGPGYTYVGLRELSRDTSRVAPRTLKGIDTLRDEFCASFRRSMQGIRRTRWTKAITTLSSDPMFNQLGLLDLANIAETDLDGAVETGRIIFDSLSSGHKVVLLTVTRVVELVSERTLVLVDEPEAYLHPPLFAALARVLSELFLSRNAVGVVSTHSPVILQEVKASSVYILTRVGDGVQAARPRVETFGENVGVLTREVFGLEVSESGYHALIRQAAEGRTYQEVLEYFGEELGAEGRALAFAYTKGA